MRGGQEAGGLLDGVIHDLLEVTECAGGDVRQEGGPVEVAAEQRLKQGGVARPLPLQGLGVVRGELRQGLVQRLHERETPSSHSHSRIIFTRSMCRDCRKERHPLHIHIHALYLQGPGAETA